MDNVNSHHRILLGHLPHYYVTKREGRLTRQEKPISTRGGSVRSILSYVVVEELATGSAHVELYPHTTAEDGPSVLLALTYAWSSGKCEPALAPVGVPSTLWVDARVMGLPGDSGEDGFSEVGETLKEICNSLGVTLKTYHSSSVPYSPVRPQSQMESLLEQAFACMDGIRVVDATFLDYRVSLAHACGVWLGLHGQVQEHGYPKGTPVSFDSDLEIAIRRLPSEWYARAGACFEGDARSSEADWKNLRPEVFWEIEEDE